MKFYKKHLIELLDMSIDEEIGFDYDQNGSIYGDPLKLKLLVNAYTWSSRWSKHYELVFAHNGKYYQTSYSIGATEYQDGSPFEYEPDLIECNEVFKKEKVVVYYE